MAVQKVYFVPFNKDQAIKSNHVILSESTRLKYILLLNIILIGNKSGTFI